jgi:hypothetical protein
MREKDRGKSEASGYNTRIAGLGSLRGVTAFGHEEVKLGNGKNRPFC